MIPRNTFRAPFGPEPITPATTNPQWNTADSEKISNRVASKAGYKRLSGNAFVKKSKAERFSEWSGRARIAHYSAQAYYESGHLLTAAILRESFNQSPESAWANFSKNKAIQQKIQRQDYLYHRRHMLIGRNRTANFTTRLTRGLSGLCELFAPIGVGYIAIRNILFQAVHSKGTIDKAGIIGGAFLIGMAVCAIFDATRSTLKMAIQHNPVLKNTLGLMLSFSAAASISALFAFGFGLLNKTLIGKIDPTSEQQEYIQFQMNQTLNRINILLLDCKKKPELLKLLNKALETKIARQYREEKTGTPLLIRQWIDALNHSGNISNIETAKTIVGQYLCVEQKSPHPEFEKFVKEKHFAALANLVEHLDTEPPQLPKELQKQCSQKFALRQQRSDAKEFTDEFSKKLNQYIMIGLKKPANAFANKFGIGKSLAEGITRRASDNYLALKIEKRCSPSYAHLNKYRSVYISTHMHQYGPITRSLMTISNTIHELNYNYLLCAGPQLSRLFTRLNMTIQDRLLDQHSSKTLSFALGRFLGYATLACITYATLSTIFDFAHTTLAGHIGQATFGWITTGTLMAILGIPALAFDLLARGTAVLEGWKGDIEPPIPTNQTWINLDAKA
jgi:hypothetical protein